MPCSRAQFEANLKNAQKSTGPKTAEGKAKSRANGLKHGLTGAGIVLPHEDAEAVDERFARLEAELKPDSELARGLVNRIALLMVKLDRSAEHEAKAIAHKMRKAEAEFVDARLTEMENHYSWIASEPATNARRLRSTPEGVARLLSVMADLRDELAHPEGHRWDWSRCEQLHHLMGLRRVDVPVSRARALSDAIEGNFRNLNQADGGDLDPKERRQWAEAALLSLIDGEIETLKTLRDGFDLEALALDREEAAHRAIFDPSPAAVLARKYEATSERGLYRAIKELRELQVIPPQVAILEEPTPEPDGELASSLPETPEAEATPPEETPAEPETVPPGFNMESQASRVDLKPNRKARRARDRGGKSRPRPQ